jgi:hypothetical protein
MRTSMQPLFASRSGRRLLLLLSLLLLAVLFYKLVYPLLFQAYVGETSVVLTFENSDELTDREFERLALSLTEQARFEQAAATVKANQDRFARQVKIEMLNQVLPRRRHPPLRGPVHLPAVPRDHQVRTRRRQPCRPSTP